MGHNCGVEILSQARIVSIEITIVFPLRIVMNSVKHIVAAAQSWMRRPGVQEALSQVATQDLLHIPADCLKSMQWNARDQDSKVGSPARERAAVFMTPKEDEAWWWPVSRAWCFAPASHYPGTGRASLCPWKHPEAS